MVAAECFLSRHAQTVKRIAWVNAFWLKTTTVPLPVRILPVGKDG
jgi:hypothetical protein